jgi:hypothetical protein
MNVNLNFAVFEITENKEKEEKVSKNLLVPIAFDTLDRLSIFHSILRANSLTDLKYTSIRRNYNDVTNMQNEI